MKKHLLKHLLTNIFLQNIISTCFHSLSVSTRAIQLLLTAKYKLPFKIATKPRIYYFACKIKYFAFIFQLLERQIIYYYKLTWSIRNLSFEFTTSSGNGNFLGEWYIPGSKKFYKKQSRKGVEVKEISG